MSHTVQRSLQRELVYYPATVAFGTFAQSLFISSTFLGRTNWPPIIVCVASDFIAISLDHYLEHHNLAKRGNGGSPVHLLRTGAVVLLISGVVLLAAILLCPFNTWITAFLFFCPAFLWDIDLQCYLGIFLHRCPSKLHALVRKIYGPQRIWSLKRIPGAKSPMIAFIRVYGTYMVICSYTEQAGRLPPSHTGCWTETQFFVWSMIDRACHATMADIRDYSDDMQEHIPTIPVILQSVQKSKCTLSLAHAITIMVCYDNPYIVLAALYAVCIVWMLDHKSPRIAYDLSYHSQTITFATYYVSQLFCNCTN